MKKILVAVLIVILIVVGYGFYSVYFSTKIHETPPEIKALNIAFEKQDLNCTRANTGHTAVGGAVLDIDANGTEEIFITGGREQRDCLFIYKNGEYTDIAAEVGFDRLDAAFGAHSVDINEDGRVDLIVGRQSGVYLYTNTHVGGNTKFVESLLYKVPERYTAVPLDISLADTDNDGDLDMYISTFVRKEDFSLATFNSTAAKHSNIFLENTGNNTFKDITEEAGLTFVENTFSATFADLDGDNLEDLTLVLNTNRTHVYKNLGNNKFEIKAVLGGYGFWMGMGMADVNNDGRLDLFLSNSGSTIPASISRGDLREDQVFTPDYALWINNGNFDFTNILPEISTNDIGFGWGIVPYDLNFDNIYDFIIRQNYVRWPAHNIKKLPGSVLVNLDGRLVESIDGSGLKSEVYGFSTLVGDFDGDLDKDVVYLNLRTPHELYENISSSGKDSFTIILPMTPEYINAKVELIFSDNSSIRKDLNRKQGVLTTQGSSVIFYYLDKTPKSIKITSAKGDERTIDTPEGSSSYRL